jgi:hypothetical protein
VGGRGNSSYRSIFLSCTTIDINKNKRFPAHRWYQKPSPRQGATTVLTYRAAAGEFHFFFYHDCCLLQVESAVCCCTCKPVSVSVLQTLRPPSPTSTSPYINPAFQLSSSLPSFPPHLTSISTFSHFFRLQQFFYPIFSSKFYGS